MNTLQRRILQCRLLLQINRYPEFAEQLGLIAKPYFRSGHPTNIGTTTT